MLDRAAGYDELIRRFRWQMPAAFNIAAACCDGWAAREPARAALLRFGADGSLTPASYGALKRDSDRLAGALRRRGVARGDRVAILLPQSVATVVAHLAVYKLAAIAVPLAALFGADALQYRLATAGAKAIVTDAPGCAKLAEIGSALPALETVISIDGADGTILDYHALLAEASEDFAPAGTTPDDPALMIFTSGTTGQPKGALHGHRVLLGHLPGFEFTHNPGPGDRMWTPSDWAWAGGLLNALLPALYHCVPVVFGPFRPFDPEEAFDLMARTATRNAFLPPTAIKMLRAVAAPRSRYDLALRSVGAAGESLGREAYEWGRAALGLPIDEFYGQTECNYVLGSSDRLGVSRAGAVGKPIPGHRVAVIGPDGTELPPDTLGQIAIARPDPTMFLGYWQNRQATDEKFIGDWMTTGDQGIRDADGYVRFVGRDDDVIISAGYRIGPAEIEDSLLGHEAVALAAAVGKPDPIRTEIVKAFIVLKPGYAPSDALAEAIRLHVRTRLSAAEYPREIAFVDSLPMTTTGKVIRRQLREQPGPQALPSSR